MPQERADGLQVLLSGTAGWKPLMAADDADDTVKNAASTAADELQDHLGAVVNAENLVVLSGSGTSIGVTAGADPSKTAPSMSALWDAVAALDTFAPATAGFTPSLLETKNFEHLLSEAQARSALKPDEAALASFIDAAERIVLEKCGFIDDDSALPQHETFLRKVARRSTRLQRTQVFTTNYDLAFETAARRARFNVIDGFGYGGTTFDGSSFDLDYVRRRPNEAPTLEPNVFHLLKLHGSVDWDQSSDVVRKSGGTPTTPVLIYPSASKYQLSYQQPYLEFMSRFQIALRQPDVGLIVVGFGFNDAHIVAPIEAALRSNIGLRVVVASPNVNAPSRAMTIGEMERLIGLGDRRLALLSGKFSDLVRLLPDVPPLEDRTVHLDRFERRRGDGR
ncbi:SIR2 family protein [Isoptericola jiangsuensis]|uniref:SIR2 family protein n=1 Tax=Isoptericola jiangsuensis TaxID=548579 RepID=UPI003AAB58BE